MIKLIGNEFKKIFKKKTIYILLAITLAYVILTNIMTKATSSNRYYYYYDDTKYYEKQLAELNPNSEADKSTYIELKSSLELSKLTAKYGPDSWQANVINTILPSCIDTVVRHEYSDEITEDAYQKAKVQYDEAMQKLASNDWKYFVNKDLEEINNSLNDAYAQKENTTDKQAIASIDTTIYDLELKKQIDEWRLEKNISYAPGFLNNALENYYNGKIALQDYTNKNISELSSDELNQYNSLLEETNLSKYYIDNNITLESDNRSILLNLFSNYELFILIIGIVIAGSIVSEEFNRGTIKLLLVKPYNRIKILLSKFIVCMLILVLSIVFIAGCQLIFGGIINGFDNLSTPAIFYNFDTNRVETMNLFAYIALIGICKLPIYILLSTLAFACSTLFASTAIAVAIPFLGYIASSLINQFALAYNIKQIIYFVTPNWDLSYYLFGGSPLFKGLTMPFSIAICAIYLVIMLVVSCIVFKKRDIKNI